MACLTLIVTIILITRLSDLAFHYFARRILKPIYRITTVHLPLLEKISNPILVLQNGTWLKAFLLMSIVPNIDILLAKPKKSRIPWFSNLFYSIHTIATEEMAEKFIETSRPFSNERSIPCLFTKADLPSEVFESSSPIKDFFLGAKQQFIFVQVDASLVKGTVISFSKK